MDPDLAEQVIRSCEQGTGPGSPGLREVIPSTMGEPLMYRDFDSLVEAVKARPGLKLNLTTNGTFPPGKTGRSPEQWARYLLPIISDVKISWNGSNAAVQESIMRRAKFEAQLKNLRTWVAVRDELASAPGATHRASITLQLTFMKRNLADIPAVVELAAREGVDRVKGHHLWAHFKEIKGDDLRRTAESVAAWNQCADECRRIAEANPLPNGQLVRLEHFEHLPPPPTTQGPAAATEPVPVDEDTECPFLGKEAWVNHAGDFAPCCAPDDQRRALGDFGNVKTAPGGLLGIWRSQQYKNLVANYKENPLCRTCHMRRKPAAATSQASVRIQPYSGFSSPVRPFSTTTATTASAGHPPKEGVLMVNHGYPPLFNAGSEIDTQNTALGLRRGGDARWRDVAVFAREADVFAPDYSVRTTTDIIDPSIPVHLVNNAREAPYMRFAVEGVDDAFRAVMAERRPQVVHFGHVNHLSVNLPRIAKQEFGASVVFTLHDFFFSCPRGQFLRVGPAPAGTQRYELCRKQDNATCASACYARRFATGQGSAADGEHGGCGYDETAYWAAWVGKRMDAFRSLCSYVDAFTAPSHHLQERFCADMGVEKQRVRFLPYGFDHARLSGRTRAPPGPGQPLVLAYIGRHVPAKGIDLLVAAAHTVARKLSYGRLRVVIYGREDGANTASIKRKIKECVAEGKAAGISSADARGLVTFAPEYANQDIVEAVFNRVDGIVVPSIWDENAPLVIHEAQQLRVPVITADAGGMRELVHDGVNGYLFAHRDVTSLAAAIERAVTDPAAFDLLGQRGYLHSEDSSVPEIGAQVKALQRIYDQISA